MDGMGYGGCDGYDGMKWMVYGQPIVLGIDDDDDDVNVMNVFLI